MKTLSAVAVLLLSATPAMAVVRGTITPRAFAAAINKVDAVLVPFRTGRLQAADVRSIRCRAPDEEPTEFQCTWQHRVKGRWVQRKTWLLVDAKGWQVMDG
ncbi:hypothetical protein [uncultured Sphingomonas sp.]|uniref:hypothetical protein n=1 Tax=uncultured Sphingomonas sp. TaxID=158754 RepID=UPI0025CCA0C9|nr:hypothetical protein [uncultured Sphingomonas sp.]